jgi:hypothetical protein
MARRPSGEKQHHLNWIDPDGKSVTDGTLSLLLSGLGKRLVGTRVFTGSLSGKSPVPVTLAMGMLSPVLCPEHRKTPSSYQ